MDTIRTDTTEHNEISKTEPTTFDTVQARTELENGKGQDAEGLVNEMIKTLSYESVRLTHEEYNAIYTKRKPQPDIWTKTEYIGIQTCTCLHCLI